jgi:small-conductance mechanosensitive channel
MATVTRSLRRLLFYLIITLVLTVGTVFIFHQFVAQPVSLSTLIEQALEIIISVVFWSLAVVIIRRSKPLMAELFGYQAATVLQYVMLPIAILVLTFGILNILKVSATALLASAGIISITAGLVTSTFVGSLLSGFLVFTTYQFKEGEEVILNGVPGKIIEMKALVTRIRTDLGQVTIPNSAIASGGVIITAVRPYEQTKQGRLPYATGDRVVTSYMSEQGTVKEISSFHTVIHLDSGKEITFLNSSVLSGSVSVAKITPN